MRATKYDKSLLYTEVRGSKMQQKEERQAITFTNEGQKLFGIIHRPLHSQKAPAILFCPGFAGNKTGKHRQFVTLAQNLAALGFVVLRFDYRGSGDSEGEFNEITIQSKTEDTLKAIHFLAEDSQVDASRIGLLGRSLGGAISILAAKQYQHIKSLVLWAPVFDAEDWKKIWLTAKQNGVDLFAKNNGVQKFAFPIPNQQFIEQFFNLHLQTDLLNLKEIPLLHIHGEKDTVVSIQHAELYQKNRESQENTKFIRLVNSDHDFSDLTELRLAMDATCEWFKQTLE